MRISSCSRGSIVLLLAGIALIAHSLTFTHVAGSLGGAGYEDGYPGPLARFRAPADIAADTSGNLYVADGGNHTIRKIALDGRVSTIAGLFENSGDADGRGAAARFSSPSGIVVDSRGDVYVADSSNHTIRKITPIGLVSTVAGTAPTPGFADATGAAARFSTPRGIAAYPAGWLWVADSGNNRIRRVAPTGEVITLAGSTFGSADGTGAAAQFRSPQGIAYDPVSGTFYVADTLNHTIRKVTLSGVVTTFAGSAGVQGLLDGTGAAARFRSPSDVAVDSSGNVWVADTGNHMVRKITPGGVVTSVAGLFGYPGPLDGMGTAARFLSPRGIFAGSGGNVFVADTGNHTLRRIDASTNVITYAGLANFSGSTNATGSSARFLAPQAVAAYPAGLTDDVLYVADTGNHSIRVIDLAGNVTLLAGGGSNFFPGSADGTGSAARFRGPRGIVYATDGLYFYVADTDNHTIRKVNFGGVVTTFAGAAGVAGNADGAGTAARFNRPIGLAVDDGVSRNLYVADSGNYTIRKITFTGDVTTLAGSPGLYGSADGTGSAARFGVVTSLSVDSSGNLYATESMSGTIRKITKDGVVTTVAGGSFGAYADGSGTTVRFGYPGPLGIAVGASGDGYIADGMAHTIRSFTSTGTVGTVGGRPLYYGATDGNGTLARFNRSKGIAVSRLSPNVYIADTDNNAIRQGAPSLSDTATIDDPAGRVGVVRQLDVDQPTATTYAWSIIRKPASSGAFLSSMTVRNPTFTPDVPDLFVFRLVATSSTGSSITTVSLQATVPSGDANGDSQVDIADVFYLINGIFAGGPAPAGAGDANGDARVSVADVFYLINYIFANGPPPV